MWASQGMQPACLVDCLVLTSAWSWLCTGDIDDLGQRSPTFLHQRSVLL